MSLQGKATFVDVWDRLVADSGYKAHPDFVVHREKVPLHLNSKGLRVVANAITESVTKGSGSQRGVFNL